MQERCYIDQKDFEVLQRNILITLPVNEDGSIERDNLLIRLILIISKE